jgi:2-polyprenyl-3-methyl-5-hydroxy-6-metoxy-1,4-benzoquinol methylase
MTLAAADSRTECATQCMLCGGASWAPHLRQVVDYLSGEQFDIRRCESCNLLCTFPMPPDAEIDRYYPPRYRGNRHGFTGRMRTNLRCRAIESCFPKNFKGRLLDVGCGDGAFVTEMRRRGWDVCATEIDPATVERLRNAGIDAKLPQEAERDGFASSVDAVTCWHVMEHVERPLQLAQWVKTQLKPGGIFQTTVPNIRSMQGRFFAGVWMHCDVPRHRYHFSPNTFRSLLTKAGYTIDSQKVFAFEYDWFGVIQSALNMVCTERNVLFEKLTLPQTEPTGTSRPSKTDVILSWVLAPPIAALSLPVMLAAWAFGDGATLTLNCRV